MYSTTFLPLRIEGVLVVVAGLGPDFSREDSYMLLSEKVVTEV